MNGLLCAINNIGVPWSFTAVLKRIVQYMNGAFLEKRGAFLVHNKMMRNKENKLDCVFFSTLVSLWDKISTLPPPAKKRNLYMSKQNFSNLVPLYQGRIT